MNSIVFVSDLVESNGKTCKENNLAIKHDIPIGTLVEITYKSKYEEPEESNYGLRLFVVNHSRDCDGTPLYDMSFDKKAYKEFEETKAKIDSGIFEDRMEEVLLRWAFQRAGGAILRHYDRNSLKIVNPCE